MKTLGDRLRELRKGRRLTQTELASRLHLTRHQISTYENDQVLPSLEVIINYCKFFNARVDFLLDIANDFEHADLEQQVINQIIKSSNRLSSSQRKNFLNQVRLYAIFLERHKENL